MKRLALLIACLAASAANTCLAAEPAACMAACTSEQRQCQGRTPEKQEKLMAPTPSERSAAGAGPRQGQMSGHNALEHDNSTASFKRLARASSCEAGFKQCSRDCGQDDQAAQKAG